MEAFHKATSMMLLQRTRRLGSADLPYVQL
jgi:hypothetical protein